MNKKYLAGLIIIIAFVALLISMEFPSKTENVQNIKGIEADYKNSTYIIEGQQVTLNKGVSEVEETPGSASKIVTKYFGNEVKHDINNDGQEDVVFLLTQNRGGSGTYFYAVAALRTSTGYAGSHAYLLGDRIAPQSTNLDEGITSQGTMRDNVIVINFSTRKLNEPFTAQPSVSKSVWIKLDPTTMQFGEVENDFEGESR